MAGGILKNGLIISFALAIAFALSTGCNDGGSSSSDDRYEPNDTFDFAAEIVQGVYSNLRCLDDDWFVVTLPEGADLDVGIDFTASLGDLDLVLYDSGQYEIDSSTGTGDAESVSIDNASAGDYYIYVYGYLGNTNRYTMTVGVDSEGLDDLYEDNDTVDDSVILTEGSYDDLKCYDNDWFKIWMTSGDSLDVAIYFEHDDGDLDMILYNPAQVEVSSSEGQEDIENVSVADASSGYFYIKVYGYSGANNSYSMDIDVTTGSTSGTMNATVIASLGIGSTMTDVAVQGSYAYVTDHDNGLHIIDVGDPSNPVLTGTYIMPSFAQGVDVEGIYAYVAGNEEGVFVVDVSDKSSPVYVNEYDTDGYAEDVTYSGGYLYVADSSDGLKVIRESDMTRVGLDNCLSFATEVEIDDGAAYAYVADAYAGLTVYSIYSPSFPYNVSNIDFDGYAYDLKIKGSYAYCVGGDYGLYIIDVSSPYSALTQESYFDTYGFANNIFLLDNYAYITVGTYGLQIVDVSDPSNPVEADFMDISSGNYTCIAVDGNYAYVGDSLHGTFSVIRIFE